LGTVPAVDSCVTSHRKTESQNSGKSLKNREMRNFSVPFSRSPTKLLGITKPLIRKKIVTPIRPKSNSCEMSAIHLPLWRPFDDICTYISEMWIIKTNKTATPRSASINRYRPESLQDAVLNPKSVLCPLIKNGLIEHLRRVRKGER